MKIIYRISISLFVAIFALVMVYPIQPAQAASVTSLKDVMSTLVDSAAANHTISFVAPSAVSNAETITVTFPTGFDASGVAATDVDIAGSTAGELTVAANCDASDEVSYVLASQTMTFTLCSGDGASFTGSETITIEIGTHAAGPGVNQIDNQTAAENATDPVIVIGGTMTDDGKLAVEIIADDSVNLTSTVNPHITFSISDTTVGFGDLSASTGRWATGDLAGGDASAALPTAAHTLSMATNANSGWSITYNGATLTSGSDTIDALGAPTGEDEDSDGEQGTEQFGLSASTDGNSTVTEGYLRDTAADWSFVTSTASEFISESSATGTETISVSYLANIATITEAGTYTTDITYIATGTF